MLPRTPPDPPPNPRGGFFRALNFIRKKESLDIDFYGNLPASRSSGAESALNDDQVGSGQLSADAIAAGYFLDKLRLKFLESLWVAIKQNCMLNTAGARNAGVHETITLADFLRLARLHLGAQLTERDEQFLALLFNCVDKRSKGAVRSTDIATALVLISEEDPIPKLKTLFRIFDADDDNCLTHDEIFDMYLSIKVNDITKDRQAMVADITFDEELSLHEAKRLYEITVGMLNAVSDFVIFEEFRRVFDERPYLIHKLLPGAFSLEWILAGYKPSSLESGGGPSAFADVARKGLVGALRHGEEHLDLAKKRGRGMRIMHNCLNHQPHQAPADDKNHGRTTEAAQLPAASPRKGQVARRASARGSLPMVSPNKTGRGPSKSGATTNPANPSPTKVSSHAAGCGCEAKRMDVDDGDPDTDDDESDEDDEVAMVYGQGVNQKDSGGSSSQPAGGATPRGLGNVVAEKIGKYMQEVSEVPQLPALSLNHANAKRFRTITLDAKTQVAYLRDKNDVHRNLKYQCLVCAVNHDFRLNKLPAASAENQRL